MPEAQPILDEVNRRLPEDRLSAPAHITLFYPFMPFSTLGRIGAVLGSPAGGRHAGARPVGAATSTGASLGLLDVAGFQLEALYGGFCGEPFDDDGREYVFVARR